VPATGAAAGDDLVFGDPHLDGWDVEDLPDGPADLRGAAQVGPAAAASFGFMADDLVRIGDPVQGRAVVAGLPAGRTVGRAAQRPGLLPSLDGGFDEFPSWSAIVLPAGRPVPSMLCSLFRVR
jgi:hypothetical protein